MIYIYYGFCVLSVIFAWIAQKKNSKILYIFSTMLVCIIVGFRGINVGIDTEVYYTYIEWIQDGIFQTSDVGFYYFAKFLLYINDSAEFVVGIFSILTIVFIFARFWSLRDRLSLPLLQFVFMAFYLQLCMNIMRQFFSISIVFWATRFLEKKKYGIYVLLNVLAVSFHKSSIIGLVLLFIYYYISEKISIKKLIILFLSLCIVPVMAIVYMNKFLGDYSNYLSSSNVNLGLMIFLKLGVLILYIVTRHKALCAKKQECIFDKTIFLIYFIGLGITALGYFYTYVDRVGLLFMLFEPVCLARMSSKGINWKIFKAFTLLLSIFLIVVNYRSNGNGIFPYTWFFIK